MPTRTVLVVDASPLSARRAEEALRGTGFSVVSAVSATEAEAAIEAGNVAVALVAVSFPRGNGYDFARQVRSRSPEAVVFLLCGGFEVFHAERAEQAGVAGKINRPFTVDTLRRHLENALGPLIGPDAPQAPGAAPPAPAPAPTVDPAPTAPARAAAARRDVSDPPADVDLVPLDPDGPRTHVGDERIASFVPRDFRTYPLVRVDPEVVGPAVERAILEVLPEVVEAVLNKAFAHSRAFRDLVEVAVDEAVRAQIGPIARRVIQERLAEIEAAGDENG